MCNSCIKIFRGFVTIVWNIMLVKAVFFIESANDLSWETWWADAPTSSTWWLLLPVTASLSASSNPRQTLGSTYILWHGTYVII